MKAKSNVPFNGCPIKGQEFSRWVFQFEVPKLNGERLKWRMRCKCGALRDVLASDIKIGKSVSCGCYQKLRASEANLSHGMTGSTEHNSWRGAKERCYDTKHILYKRYGGRGIRMCDRWRNSFEDFLSDMGPKPSPNHQIDRYPNQNGHYEPGNCRWATRKEQCNNKTTNHLLSYKGRTQTMMQWSRELGINYYTLRSRKRIGYTDEQAITGSLNH